MPLIDQVSEAKHDVFTETIQISVSELSTMYEENELIINPEFQRLFRWELAQKSALVESILVGIPIPSIFVFEREDGKWELIDGLQRISTLLEFQGKLKLDRTVLPQLKLCGTKYLTGLDDVVWSNDGLAEPGIELETALKLNFKRARIPVEVLKQPSNEEAKFELFQRLNRGGQQANDQEIRTCVMVMLDADFVADIRELVSTEAFKNVFGITEKQQEEQGDLDYVTRCLVSITEYFDQSYRDVSSYYSDKIASLITEKRHIEALDRFKDTLNFLYDNFGDDALKPTNPIVRNTISHRNIELVFVGVARNLEGIISTEAPVKFVTEKIDELWKEVPDKDFSRPGMRSTQRLTMTLPYGSNHFQL
ncbi:DUF262 domain-containing protein [Maritalea myrionectae]|uniref:DUF262 domain-containing protein n=1 Tax=Maritalea myrionectae TaxID=454601 RepID=UPI00055C27DD|nr:DUF262 domain-containing protein [Maritalea myrionectae]